MLTSLIFALGFIGVHAGSDACVKRYDQFKASENPVTITYESHKKEYEILLVKVKTPHQDDCQKLSVHYSTEMFESTFTRWTESDLSEDSFRIDYFDTVADDFSADGGFTFYSFKWNFYSSNFDLADIRMGDPPFKKLKVVFKCVNSKGKSHVIAETPMVNIVHFQQASKRGGKSLTSFVRLTPTDETPISLDECFRTTKRTKTLEIEDENGMVSWKTEDGTRQTALVAFDRSMNAESKNAAKFIRKWTMRVTAPLYLPPVILYFSLVFFGKAVYDNRGSGRRGGYGAYGPIGFS